MRPMSDREFDELLVVIPAFNEARTIFDVVRSAKDLGYQVLVVDDCSSDITASRASEAGAEVLSLPINLGVGGALRAGFRFAIARGFTCVVQVDGDGQHPVHEIGALVQFAKSADAHLVIGSRYLSTSTSLQLSRTRRCVMRVFGLIASRIAGYKLTDTTSGFRVIHEPLLSEFARTFPTDYLGDTFQSTISAIRSGYKVLEAPASLADRKFGKSSAGTFYAASRILKVTLLVLWRLSPPLRRFSDVRGPQRNLG